MSRILFLGGGSAGIMAAARLRNALSMDEAQITIIDRSDTHYYQPGNTLVCFGLDEPEYLTRPMESVIPAGCTFIKDEVTAVKPDDRYVELASGKKVEYDYLVIATGTKLMFNEMEGLTENLGKNGIHTFYTLDGAIETKKALEEFEGGNFTVVQPPMPFKCPGAPIKFTLMADDYFRRKNMRNKVNLTLTTALPAVFSREPYASKLTEMFKDRNINLQPKFNPGKVDTDKGVVASWEKIEVPYDMAVIIPPQEGEPMLEDSPFVDAVNFVRADKHKLITEEYDNIFAVGDCANYPTSKTASGARKQAEVLVPNLIARIKGKELKGHYTGHIICPVLTRYGKAIFVEFDYDKSISPAEEMSSSWMMKIYGLRPLYWSMMLRGRL
jgi:sulfide:quinone oxidoreductase